MSSSSSSWCSGSSPCRAVEKGCASGRRVLGQMLVEGYIAVHTRLPCLRRYLDRPGLVHRAAAQRCKSQEAAYSKLPAGLCPPANQNLLGRSRREDSMHRVGGQSGLLPRHGRRSLDWTALRCHQGHRIHSHSDRSLLPPGHPVIQSRWRQRGTLRGSHLASLYLSPVIPSRAASSMSGARCRGRRPARPIRR